MNLQKTAGRLCALLAVSGMLLLASRCGLYDLRPYVVLSGSMEPNYPAGSVILTNTTPDGIGTQDVITYRIGEQLITHRVIRMNEEGYVTKGDNNPAEDPGTVSPDQVVGKVISCIPYIGYLVLFLHRPYAHFFLLFAAAVSVVLHFMKTRTFKQEERNEKC